MVPQGHGKFSTDMDLSQDSGTANGDEIEQNQLKNLLSST